MILSTTARQQQRMFTDLPLNRGSNVIVLVWNDSRLIITSFQGNSSHTNHTRCADCVHVTWLCTKFTRAYTYEAATWHCRTREPTDRPTGDVLRTCEPLELRLGVSGAQLVRSLGRDDLEAMRAVLVGRWVRLKPANSSALASTSVNECRQMVEHHDACTPMVQHVSIDSLRRDV